MTRYVRRSISADRVGEFRTVKRIQFLYLRQKISKFTGPFQHHPLRRHEFGYLIVWVFSQTDTSTAADGAKAGAILGLLLFLGLNLIMYGVFEMHELSTNLVDVLVGTVRFGVAGAVVGWYLGRDASESASSEVASSESISSDLASTESTSTESTSTDSGSSDSGSADSGSSDSGSSDSAREGGF